MICEFEFNKISHLADLIASYGEISVKDVHFFLPYSNLNVKEISCQTVQETNPPISFLMRRIHILKTAHCMHETLQKSFLADPHNMKKRKLAK